MRKINRFMPAFCFIFLLLSGACSHEKQQSPAETVLTDISSQLYEGFEINSGEYYGDLDHDGQEDYLNIEVRDPEFTGGTDQLQLKLSTVDESFVLRDLPFDFYDILCVDLDQDTHKEIILVFDLHGVGAEGSYGLYILKNRTNMLENLTGDTPFSGCTFDVTLNPDEHQYELFCRETGAAYTIFSETMTEYSLGTVLPFSYITAQEAAGRSSVIISQYVAGEDKTDHIADIITEFSLENDEIKILDQYMSLTGK